MTQITKGVKYIFGWSEIRECGKVIFPPMVIEEYGLQKESYIYIVSGSKQTGGFCVIPEPLFSKSKLKNILEDNPNLAKRTIKEGELISYKGRKYGWLRLNNNSVQLLDSLMKDLEINIGDRLLSIWSSDISFTMGVKGRIIEKATSYKGKIEEF